MNQTFREEDRVLIAEFHGVGPFQRTVIQADDEQVEVLVDEEEDNKHFCTMYPKNFRLLSHADRGLVRKRASDHRQEGDHPLPTPPHEGQDAQHQLP